MLAMLVDELEIRPMIACLGLDIRFECFRRTRRERLLQEKAGHKSEARKRQCPCRDQPAESDHWSRSLTLRTAARCVNCIGGISMKQ